MAFIALGVTGSVAAYKAVEVARGLQKNGHDVTVIMTAAAERFIGSLTFEAITRRDVITDQFAVGLTLNILIFGLTGFLDREFDPATKTAARWAVPILNKVPLVGKALFGQPWPFYILYVLIPLSWWLVYRTRWGLELRAAGENPQSADVSGIDVNRRRRQAIYYAGLTSGLGGAFLVFVQVGRFEDSVVGGRGFIAIAAVIFGGWTLRGTILGCVVFAAALSFRLSIQGLGYQVNSELLQALPFLVTILGMALFAHRVRPPAALARPFVRGLR